MKCPYCDRELGDDLSNYFVNLYCPKCSNEIKFGIDKNGAITNGGG
jgi:hypothetical protein